MGDKMSPFYNPELLTIGERERAIEMQKSLRDQQEMTRYQFYPYTKMPCRIEDERRMNWTCPGFEK